MTVSVLVSRFTPTSVPRMSALSAMRIVPPILAIDFGGAVVLEIGAPSAPALARQTIAANKRRIFMLFPGLHLCERLLSDGHDVLCIDNFFTGGKDNILHLISNPHFELMRHDVTFPLYVEVDEIYNLACPASPVH